MQGDKAMTLKQLIQWAKDNNIPEDAPMYAWNESNGYPTASSFTDIDSVCLNGMCVQLNVRTKADQEKLMALEKRFGPDKALEMFLESKK